MGADPEATLRRVLNEEIAHGRIVYDSANRCYELNGKLDAEVREALGDLRRERDRPFRPRTLHIAPGPRRVTARADADRTRDTFRPDVLQANSTPSVAQP